MLLLYITDRHDAVLKYNRRRKLLSAVAVRCFHLSDLHSHVHSPAQLALAVLTCGACATASPSTAAVLTAREKTVTNSAGMCASAHL